MSCCGDICGLRANDWWFCLRLSQCVCNVCVLPRPRIVSRTNNFQKIMEEREREGRVPLLSRSHTLANLACRLALSCLVNCVSRRHCCTLCSPLTVVVHSESESQSESEYPNSISNRIQ